MHASWLLSFFPRFYVHVIHMLCLSFCITILGWCAHNVRRFCWTHFFFGTYGIKWLIIYDHWCIWWRQSTHLSTPKKTANIVYVLWRRCLYCVSVWDFPYRKLDRLLEHTQPRKKVVIVINIITVWIRRGANATWEPRRNAGWTEAERSFGRSASERERERGGVVEASVTEVYEVRMICIEINLFVVGLSHRMACAVCTTLRHHRCFPFALLVPHGMLAACDIM